MAASFDHESITDRTERAKLLHGQLSSHPRLLRDHAREGDKTVFRLVTEAVLAARQLRFEHRARSTARANVSVVQPAFLTPARKDACFVKPQSGFEIVAAMALCREHPFASRPSLVLCADRSVAPPRNGTTIPRRRALRSEQSTWRSSTTGVRSAG